MDTAEQNSTVYVDYISALIGLRTSKLVTYIGCCVQCSYKHECEYFFCTDEFYVNLTQTRVIREEESQLRKNLHKIRLQGSLCSIFLTSD